MRFNCNSVLDESHSSWRTNKIWNKQRDAFHNKLSIKKNAQQYVSGTATHHVSPYVNKSIINNTFYSDILTSQLLWTVCKHSNDALRVVCQRRCETMYIPTTTYGAELGRRSKYSYDYKLSILFTLNEDVEVLQ